MDECQKLTVASTWRFDPETLHRQLETQEQIFCKYEPLTDVLTFDSHGIIGVASTLGQLLASVIDDEKDNDLLEKPKISRIIVPSPAQELDREPEPADGEPNLIDTSVDMQEDLPASFQSKYWESKDGGIECFLMLPYDLLAEVADATGAHLSLEAENQRIRVSSNIPAWIENALDKLTNLERSISLLTSPHVENILHVPEGEKFRLRLRLYGSLNNLALRRLLVDPSTKGANQLGKMYATSIEFLNPDTKSIETPKNIVAPPRPTPLRKGHSKLWNDYLCSELGDAANLLGLPQVDVTPTHERLCLSKETTSPIPLEEAETDNHPFLSREKVSRVDKWVTEGFEAGAVGPSSSEPNILDVPSPELEPPPATVAGIKRRVAMPIGTSIHKTSDAPESKNAIPKPLPIATTSPPFEPHSMSTIPDKSEVRASCVKPSGSQNKTTDLIDMSSCPNMVPASIPKLSFYQSPLIPTRVAQDAFPVTSRLSSTTPHGNLVLSPAYPKSTVQSHAIDKDKEDQDLTGACRMNYDLDEPASTGKDQLQCIAVSGENTESPNLDPLGVSSRKQGCPPLRTLNSSTYGHFYSELPNRKDAAVSNPEQIKERLQGVSEIDTRIFRKTMRQQSAVTESKRGSKASRKAKKQATIANAWGTPVLLAGNVSAKQTDASGPSKWKREQQAESKTSETNRIKDLYNTLDPILAAVQRFTGILSLEIQFGMVLIHSVPKMYADKAIDVKTWERLFRPQHGIRGPGTRFMNLLTASGADVDYILSLKDDARHRELFAGSPSTRHITYEFHCQTKNNQLIVVNVNDSGETIVTRPEAVLGSVNVHFPHQIWDMRVAIKGAQEYSPGIDKEIDIAVEGLISNLYICPNRAKVLLYTRLDNSDVLRITKVLMRRSTRHRCFEDVDVPKSVPEPPRGRDTFTPDKTSTAGSEHGLFLQITEVQNLLLGQMATNKALIRARALSPEEMVDNSRLWYEVSIVSPAIEKILESNRNLSVGARTWNWEPHDLLGVDASITTEHAAEAKRRVGADGLPNMYRIASRLTAKIDGVGWANPGPGIEVRASLPASSSVAAGSTLAVAAVPVVENKPITNISASQDVFGNLDSVSTRNAEEAEEFW
ncbi:predicted protein [Uncinocarpus reesii 1704]|uniref:Uncharacterized protein n=1 Tax=Uncinocarpus reesii (strain UAMH 1704) TaxID=336963 RepID=C4JIW3_UNCRE|nr:uncharacterized protein UREG_01570 [Uncinocarpus reesii 1704]EEP76721.1 predicted protein [Uncinocarpus reesii 1704]